MKKGKTAIRDQIQPEIGCDIAYKPNLCWRKDCLNYTVEVNCHYVAFYRAIHRQFAGPRDVWLEGKSVGKASNFRSTSLQDGRSSVIVCDVVMDNDIWKAGWDDGGFLKQWAEEGESKLRVMDVSLVGPVEEVPHDRAG